jgi:hypothetical protein
MGAWGQKAFENDDAMEWLGDLNRDMKLASRLRRDIKQKKDAYTTRAAIEYLIRSDKARLHPVLEFEELTLLAMKRIVQIKVQYADPKFWAWDSKEPIPKNELKEINRAIRQTTADLDRQFHYLEKAEAARLNMERGTLSKGELSEAYEKLKKRMKKSGKGKGPKKATPRRGLPGLPAESYMFSREELADSYAKLRGEAKASKKKTRKKKTRKKKAKKKARKKR